VRVELRGSAPGNLSAGILEHLNADLAHLEPKVATTRGDVMLDVLVISPGPDEASNYARERVARSLMSAGLIAWSATVVEVVDERGPVGG
jgi:hypothetical protein